MSANRVLSLNPEPPGVPGKPASSRRPVVLLAEDEESIRNFVRMALEYEGYEVVTAADAEEALARFRTDPARFDLVFSDVIMPGRSGAELAAAVRAVRPGVRVLFMSAYAGDFPAYAVRLPAGSELLEKPFTLEQLLAAVSRTILGQ